MLPLKVRPPVPQVVKKAAAAAPQWIAMENDPPHLLAAAATKSNMSATRSATLLRFVKTGTPRQGKVAENHLVAKTEEMAIIE